MKSLYFFAVFVSFFASVLHLSWVGVHRLYTKLEAGSEIVLFAETRATEQDVSQIKDRVIQMFPDIPSVTVVSKEKAYERAAQDAALTKSLLLLKENPFPASIVLRMSPQWWKTHTDPGFVFEPLPLISDVRWSALQTQFYRHVVFLHEALLRFLIGALMILVCWIFWNMWIYRTTLRSFRLLGKLMLCSVGVGGGTGLVFMINFLIVPLEFRSAINGWLFVWPTLAAFGAFLSGLNALKGKSS